MKLSVGTLLKVVKILIFTGLGIFMLVADKSLSLSPIIRIAWGLILLGFAAFRTWSLVLNFRKGED